MPRDQSFPMYFPSPPVGIAFPAKHVLDPCRATGLFTEEAWLLRYLHGILFCVSVRAEVGYSFPSDVSLLVTYYADQS